MIRTFIKKHRRVILVCLLLAGICAALIIALNKPEPPPAALPKAYVPYPIDAHSAPEANIGNLAELPILQTDMYKITLNPEMSLNDAGECDIRFVNSRWNDCYLMFDIREKRAGTLIYRSGMIEPGFGVANITLADAATALLREAGNAPSITLTVYSFALENYQSMGETAISLVINLQSSH